MPLYTGGSAMHWRYQWHCEPGNGTLLSTLASVLFTCGSRIRLPLCSHWKRNMVSLVLKLVHSLSHVCYAIQFNVLMSTRSRSISWIISRKFFWRIRDFLFCSITCICTFYSVSGIWDSLVPRFHPHSRCDTWEQGNRICLQGTCFAFTLAIHVSFVYACLYT